MISPSEPLSITIHVEPAAPGWSSPAQASENPGEQAWLIDSKGQRDGALASLINTNEAMRHRAADCRLADIVDVTGLVALQLAHVQAAGSALTPARIGMLRHVGQELAHQLDAHFDGKPIDARVVPALRTMVVSMLPAICAASTAPSWLVEMALESPARGSGSLRLRAGLNQSASFGGPDDTWRYAQAEWLLGF